MAMLASVGTLSDIVLRPFTWGEVPINVLVADDSEMVRPAIRGTLQRESDIQSSERPQISRPPYAWPTS